MLKVVNLFSIFLLNIQIPGFFMRVKQFFPLHTFVIETPDRRKEDAKGIETPSQLFNEHALVLACLLEQSLAQIKFYGSNSYPFRPRITLLIKAKCRSLDFVGMTIASHSRFIQFMIHCFWLFKKTINVKTYKHIYELQQARDLGDDFL